MSGIRLAGCVRTALGPWGSVGEGIGDCRHRWHKVGKRSGFFFKAGVNKGDAAREMDVVVRDGVEKGRGVEADMGTRERRSLRWQCGRCWKG